MYKKIVHLLRPAVPFIAVLVLWRLAVPMWNPGGILAMIPIFYYSFIRPIPWFAPYAVFSCFLMDYTCDTVLYWTALYCALYAAVGLQSMIDPTKWNNGGMSGFTIFWFLAIFILFLSNITLTNFVHTAWLGVWACMLYTPVVALINWGRHDR